MAHSCQHFLGKTKKNKGIKRKGKGLTRKQRRLNRDTHKNKYK